MVGVFANKTILADELGTCFLLLQKYSVKEFVYKSELCSVASGGGATVCSEDAVWWCANDTASETTFSSLRPKDESQSQSEESCTTLKVNFIFLPTPLSIY